MDIDIDENQNNPENLIEILNEEDIVAEASTDRIAEKIPRPPREFENYYDQENPRKILYDDIEDATDRIAGTIMKTPCEERGVRNILMMLSEPEKKRGVITANVGNLGIALSYHCSLLGIRCTLVMPEGVATTKMDMCMNFGARVILHGDNFDAANNQAIIISYEKKLCYFDGYDHPFIIEGHGSLGMEIIEQIPDVDAILIPVGGGSLLAGVAVAAKHLKPDIFICGIETNKTCSMGDALRRGKRVFCDTEKTLAAALNVNKVGATTLHNVKDIVDEMIIVQEDWVARGVTHLMDEEKLVVEGGGAVSVAAIMAGQLSHLQSKKVVCILTGGNISAVSLLRVVQRGLAVDGRLLKFKVTLLDRPGEIALLCAYLAKVGVVLRDFVPKRTWFREDVFTLELHVIVETRGWDHANELVAILRKHYNDCNIQHDQDHMSRPTGPLIRASCLAPDPACMEPKSIE